MLVAFCHDAVALLNLHEMARLGPVHGCVARQVGERERIMSSVQWVGCGMQAFLDGDSC